MICIVYRSYDSSQITQDIILPASAIEYNRHTYNLVMLLPM